MRGEKKEYWNKAARDYNVAINSGETNLEAIYSASIMYTTRRMWEKYRELSEIAFSVAPNNYRIRTNLIASYLANDQFDLAEEIANLVRFNHHMSETAIEQFEQWYEKSKLINHPGGQIEGE